MLQCFSPAWLTVAAGVRGGISGKAKAGISAMLGGCSGRARLQPLSEHRQLETGLPSPVKRSQGQAGRLVWVPSVAGGLPWKPNQHLRSTLQAARLLLPAGKLPLISPTGTFQLPGVQGSEWAPQEPLQLPGESQCLFQSHINMTKHHNAFSSSGFKQSELLSFHCN